MLIPIGDWNTKGWRQFRAPPSLKSCLSPLGIETRGVVNDRWATRRLKSCLSPLGIETCEGWMCSAHRTVWNHAYPHWGLKLRVWGFRHRGWRVWNHAYPHWGLKPSSIIVSVALLVFEIMLIPIGDWNPVPASPNAGVCGSLKSCLSPLGIETLINGDAKIWLMGLKSCLSPLGIETAPACQYSPAANTVWNHAYPHWGLKPPENRTGNTPLRQFEIMLIPIGDWNTPDVLPQASVVRFEIMLIPIGDWNTSLPLYKPKTIGLKSCLSPLGIETDKSHEERQRYSTFEIMLIPIGDWNESWRDDSAYLF